MVLYVAINEKAMKITLEHADIYYMTKECSNWWSFGKELGIGFYEILFLKHRFGSFEESLSGRKARIVVLHKFISQYKKTSHDTMELLTTLSTAARKLGCHDIGQKIGILTI